MSKPTAEETLRFVRDAINSELSDFQYRVAVGTIVRGYFKHAKQSTDEQVVGLGDVVAIVEEEVADAKEGYDNSYGIIEGAAWREAQDILRCLRDEFGGDDDDEQ